MHVRSRFCCFFVKDLSIRVKDPVGLRFKTQVNNLAKKEKTDFEITEYGFIIASEEVLLNKVEQLNFNASKFAGFFYTFI